MKAFKCDRCGGFYESYDGILFIKGEEYGMVYSYITLTSGLRSKVDLCPGCMKEFHSFLGLESVIETDEPEEQEQFYDPVKDIAGLYKKIDYSDIYAYQPNKIKNHLIHITNCFDRPLEYNDLLSLKVEDFLNAKGLGIHTYIRIINSMYRLGFLEYFRDPRHKRNLQLWHENPNKATRNRLLAEVLECD